MKTKKTTNKFWKGLIQGYKKHCDYVNIINIDECTITGILKIKNNTILVSSTLEGMIINIYYFLENKNKLAMIQFDQHVILDCKKISNGKLYSELSMSTINKEINKVNT